MHPHHLPQRLSRRTRPTAPLALFLLLLALPLPAATYLVSTAGNDVTGNGSLAAPWLTPQKAVNSVAPGDTILLGSGTFPAPVIKTVAGTAAARITLDGQNGATLNTRLDIRKPYWTVQNLTVKGLASPVAHVAITNGAHYTYLLNLLIDNEHRAAIPPETTFHHGIEMSSTGGGPFNPDWPSNCRIANCTITRVKGAVCIITTGANNVFENNRMYDLIQADNFRLFGENHIVRGNECYDNRVSTAGSVGFHGDFIQCFGGYYGSRNHIIEGNYVHDNEMQIAQTVEGSLQLPALIGTGATSNHTWRNNLFVRNQLGCSVTLPGGKWYNNTFYKCAYATGHVINLGEDTRGSSDGTEIYNNVFLDCGDPAKDSVGWYGDGSVGQTVSYTANHNFVAKNNFRPVRGADIRSVFRFHEDEAVGVLPNQANFLKVLVAPLSASQGAIRIGSASYYETDDQAGNVSEWNDTIIGKAGRRGIPSTNTVTSTTNPDSDGDGFTDGQEVNTNASNPFVGDTDGDGFTDGFEAGTGFDPTRVESQPDQLSTIRRALEFRFSAASGVSYRVEASTDLRTWTTVETDIIGTGTAVTRFYVEEELGPRSFLRARKNQ